MAGVLGIGSDVLAWTQDQRTRAARLIGLYQTIRRTIHTGRVEFHGLPADPVHAVEYGSAEQTVLLAYARAARAERVVLAPKTLCTDRTYRLVGTDRQLGGAEARAGIVVPFALAPDADVVILE